MAVVTAEDITVAWGSQPPSIEATTARWRTGVFQDVQESSDARYLYFLYDPIADERSGTTGGHRRGNNCIVVFDLSMKCFIQEIPIFVPGKPKFLFALRPLSVGGDTRAIIVSQIDNGGSAQLHFTLLNITTQQQVTITRPLDVASDFICTIREDAPELIVMANPGLQVWRIAADVMGPTEPLEYFKVDGAHLSQFYDGFICGGTVFLVSAYVDETLDYTRIHLLDMQTRSLTTYDCTEDPSRGFPVPRLQAAIVTVPGFIIVSGGEVMEEDQYGGTSVQRLNDYWRLDLKSFQWSQCRGEMPVPLIEPRITTTYGGYSYLWGDWDGVLPGVQDGLTHLRIIRVNGLDQTGGYEKPYPDAHPPLGFVQNQQHYHQYDQQQNQYSSTTPYPPPYSPYN